MAGDYDEAERRIAEAKASGARELSLRGLDIDRLSDSLRTLTRLETLDLRGCQKLADIRAVSCLMGLKTLLCGVDTNAGSWWEQSFALSDIKPVSDLKSLQQLNLSLCRQLTDVSVLSSLTGLQQLYLSGCSQLKDVSVLSSLTGLQQLDLSWCNALTDVSGLSSLTGLQKLDLSGCSELTDVSVLSSLTGLRQLDLSGCSELMDVSVLSSLTGLQKLNVRSSVALPVGIRDLPLTWWPALETLYANRLGGAPVEIGSEDDYSDNCLPRIKAWHRDLADGVAPNADLKLFVLGNGRVGKTQICRRLKGERFDASIPSTHGISLGQTRLIEGDTEADPPEQAVDLRFWDFGGQDVYLGTHALFLDDRAVYVIAWAPSHENTDEFEENGVPMRNRPLRYWLEYVRSLAGPKAPVIVVQTQCDRERDVSSAPPIPVDHGFERLRVADCSAKTKNGMARLMLELESAARYQLERYGEVPLPANWVAVGDDLRRMRDEQGRRTLPRDAFEHLCAEQHQTAVPGVVLEYLHRSGQVFWKEGVFGDQVVLDQAWALDGMYAVLHRESALPLIRQQHGRFTPQLLALLVWQNRTEEERQLFLSMMEKCQTCFKIAEDTHVAPALLPLENAVAGQIAGLWQGAEAQAEVKLHYAFLHEGVLRALLCGIGSRAGVQAVYWRYGVCFYDQKAAGVVRIRSALPDPSGQDGGWMSVETTGANAAALAREVVGSIEQINIGQKPEVKWMNSEPSETRRMPGDDNGQEPFARLTPGPVPRAADAPIPVYVSYAWEDASQAFVDEVGQRLPADRFEFRRDKTHLQTGDWISSFMAEIGRADCVLVVLSDKYLRSPNCMRELLHLYQRSQGDRADLMGRIVAVVPPELKIDRATGRAVYIRHWRDEHKALESVFQDLGIAAMGAADREEWLAIQDFQRRVSDIMAWVSDVLMPRGDGSLDAAIARIEARANA
ncbi:leucine-rich repeat domain-containing protein [Sphaerotilus sulfidivorans]